jgi:hypothetical protein
MQASINPLRAGYITGFAELERWEETEEPHHGESQHPARRQVAASREFEA